MPQFTMYTGQLLMFTTALEVSPTKRREKSLNLRPHDWTEICTFYYYHYHSAAGLLQARRTPLCKAAMELNISAKHRHLDCIVYARKTF